MCPVLGYWPSKLLQSMDSVHLTVSSPWTLIILMSPVLGHCPLEYFHFLDTCHLNVFWSVPGYCLSKCFLSSKTEFECLHSLYTDHPKTFSAWTLSIQMSTVLGQLPCKCLQSFKTVCLIVYCPVTLSIRTSPVFGDSVHSNVSSLWTLSIWISPVLGHCLFKCLHGDSQLSWGLIVFLAISLVSCNLNFADKFNLYYVHKCPQTELL